MQLNDQIARNVGGPLTDLEHAWLAAVRDGGQMLTAVAEASSISQAEIGVSSDVVDRCLEGLGHLGAAGRSWASLHSRLSAIARLNRLEPSSYGQSPGMPAAEPAPQDPERVPA